MDLPRRGASNESEFFVYLIAGVVMSTAGRPKFGSWTAAALELGSVIARRRISAARVFAATVISDHARQPGSSLSVDPDDSQKEQNGTGN